MRRPLFAVLTFCLVGLPLGAEEIILHPTDRAFDTEPRSHLHRNHPHIRVEKTGPQVAIAPAGPKIWGKLVLGERETLFYICHRGDQSFEDRLAPRLLYFDFDCDRNFEEEEPIAMDPGLSKMMMDPHFVLPPLQARFRMGGEHLHVHMKLRIGLLLPNLVRAKTVLVVHPYTWFAGKLPVSPECRVLWAPGEKPRFRMGMKTVSSSALYFGEDRLAPGESRFRVEGGKVIYSYGIEKAEGLESMAAPADLLSIWARHPGGEHGEITCFPSRGKIYLPAALGYEIRAVDYLRNRDGENWLLHSAGGVEFHPGEAFPSPESLKISFSLRSRSSTARGNEGWVTDIRRLFHTDSGHRVGLWRENRKLSFVATELIGPGGDLLHTATGIQTAWRPPASCLGSKITIGARLASSIPFEIRVEETVFTP